MDRLPYFILVFFLPILCCCHTKVYTNNEKIIGYNLTAPDAEIALPHVLHEISGITYVDSSSFACIQDEKGIIFVYNFQKDKIKKKYTFNIDGDYEGIARVNDTIYVLRSDGMLFEIAHYKLKNFHVTSYVTGIPANNNEGLCYDPDNNRLLIASKGKIGKGHELKDLRVIYGFDLKTKTMIEDPVYDFDLQSIKEFALKENPKHHKKNKKRDKVHEPDIKFMTSDIAIHPITKKLFLLSATDYMLFIFDRSGNLEHIEKLMPELFPQAEGITFMPDGELLIANEGHEKPGTLLRFKYKL
ncbi:MAG: SdiA-regulated domain-containing protein [Candidatus Saccharibacteria bacterium]